MIAVIKKERWIRVWIRTLFLFFCIFLIPMPAFCRIAVIPMQYRTAAEALPMVREMLSSSGRAVADARTNSLLIDDEEAAIERIRQFLYGFDALGKQARIRVRFSETVASEGHVLSGRGKVSGDDWSIGTGGRKKTDGMDFNMKGRAQDKTGASEYFINVVSGSWAYIWVGKDILYHERWDDFFRRYARKMNTTIIRRIETGMEARPTILKGHAEVEIVPRISHEQEKGGQEVIRFTEASTHIVVPLSQWVLFSGGSTQSQDLYRAILDTGRGRESSGISLFLMVEEVE